MQSHHDWIAPDEYYWTPDEWFKAWDVMTPEGLAEIRACTGGCFFRLPLSEQCKLLGATYHSVSLNSPDTSEFPCIASPTKNIRIEQRILEALARQEWVGDRLEGLPFLFATHIIASRIVEAGILYLPGSGYPTYSRNVVNEVEEQLLREGIKDIRQNGFGRWIDAWRKDPYCSCLPLPTTTGWNLEGVCKCIEAMSDDMLLGMCKQDMLGHAGHGWPDLTVTRDGRLRLIEAKLGYNKFTHRQAYWYRNYSLALGWNVEVWHVKR